jgi:hypothetical protein
VNKSGLADSPFFAAHPSNVPMAVAPPVSEPPVIKAEADKSSQLEKVDDTKPPRHHDTTVSSNRDTTLPRIQDTTIEIIRKAVREQGKEAATHRFTQEEKKAVMDIVYAYRGVGIKTSENELARIAMNFIFEDYSRNGKNSILDQVLKALNK